MSSVPITPIRGVLAWAAVAVLAAICGCQNAGDAGRTSSTDVDPRQVERCQVQRGPVRLVVEAAPKLARLSDEPTLTVTIDVERGVEVDKPPFGEALGDFIIRDFREPPVPEIKDDREILRQIYTLEPVRAGKLRIQPISVSFTDNRPTGDGRRHTIQSEPLAIEVTTVLNEETPSLHDLAGLDDPIELPERTATGRWLLAAAAPLTLLAAWVAVWFVRRRRILVAEIVPPQELAYWELQQLLDEGWQDQNVKLFYVGLTGVVRRYIERTTGVHAPEQTTEEFLREAGEGDVFPPQERERLRAFLESADLVKFAAHLPGKEDVAQTFRRAKIFIGLESLEEAA